MQTIRYVYDLRIPIEVPLELTPLDGEVESFEVRRNIASVACDYPTSNQCLPLHEVVALMRSGLFKANCAVGEFDIASQPSSDITVVKRIPISYHRLHGPSWLPYSRERIGLCRDYDKDPWKIQLREVVT